MPYHKMKLYVGIFVSFLFVGIITTIGFIMQKKGYFEEQVNFYFTTTSASVFYVGMPLNVSGFVVGSISELKLMDNGDVKVFFRVSQNNHKWIREDTLLMLDKPLIGSPSISILTSLAYDKLQKNQEVQIIIRDDINDIIVNFQPIIEELQQIIHSVNTLTLNLSSKDGALEKSLDNIEVLTHKLASDEALLTALTGDRNSTNALNKTLYKGNEVLTQVQNLTKEVNLMLQTIQTQLLEPASLSMQSVHAIFQDIEHKLSLLDGTVKTLGSYDEDLLLLKKELHINLDKTHHLLEKVDMMLSDDSDAKILLP